MESKKSIKCSHKYIHFFFCNAYYCDKCLLNINYLYDYNIYNEYK